MISAVAKRFGRHGADAQFTTGFMAQRVRDGLLELIGQLVEFGLNRKNADRATEVIPMGMVVVVHQLQVPETQTARNTASQRPEPRHPPIRQAIGLELGEEVVHRVQLSREEIGIPLIPVERWRREFPLWHRDRHLVAAALTEGANLPLLGHHHAFSAQELGGELLAAGGSGVFAGGGHGMGSQLHPSFRRRSVRCSVHVRSTEALNKPRRTSSALKRVAKFWHWSRCRAHPNQARAVAVIEIQVSRASSPVKRGSPETQSGCVGRGEAKMY